MATSETSKQIAADLAKSLQVTTTLIQTLLSELRDNATALAVLKEKLDGIEEKVQSLSHIVRDDNGNKSIITRLALLEKEIEDIGEFMDDNKEESVEIHARISKVKSLLEADRKSESDFTKAQTLGWLKVVGTIAPGVLALGLMIAELFFSK